MTEFYEPDEPALDVIAAFERGLHGFTVRPKRYVKQRPRKADYVTALTDGTSTDRDTAQSIAEHLTSRYSVQFFRTVDLSPDSGPPRYVVALSLDDAAILYAAD